MRSIFFVLICLLTTAPTWIWAQNQSLFGYVRDGASNAALPGAFLTFPGSELGTYTNAEGFFVLEMDGEKHKELAVRYLGYETQVLKINGGMSRPLEIEMKLASVELAPTLITDQALRRVHPDPELYIKDYAFMGENLLMIVFDPILRRNKLLLLNEDMEPLDEHFGFGDAPVSLHTDCMGMKHYLGKNYSCQIDWVDGELQLQKSSRAEFERVVRPCRGRLEETYFFEDPRGKFHTGFYLVEEEERVKKGFYWTSDTVALTTLEDESLFYERFATLEDYFPSVYQAKYRMTLDDLYLKEVQCVGGYTPMFTIGKSVYIFDHNRKLILSFKKNGYLNQAVPISYDEERSWERQILVNEEGTRAFTLFLKMGMSTLGEIDLKNGDVLRRWELPKQFVRNIQVKGDEIYFLYKESMYDPVLRLYAFDMNW